jgi:hypothetical protein
MFLLKSWMEIHINPSVLWYIVAQDKKKMKPNTEDEYNNALASDDPTVITKETQEKLVHDAIKKFKSL